MRCTCNQRFDERSVPPGEEGRLAAGHERTARSFSTRTPEIPPKNTHALLVGGWVGFVLFMGSCRQATNEQFSIQEHLLRRGVKHFRGGLVFKAHRLVHHSILGWRVIKKEKKDRTAKSFSTRTPETPTCRAHRWRVGWCVLNAATKKTPSHSLPVPRTPGAVQIDDFRVLSSSEN